MKGRLLKLFLIVSPEFLPLLLPTRIQLYSFIVVAVDHGDGVDMEI